MSCELSKMWTHTRCWCVVTPSRPFNISKSSIAIPCSAANRSDRIVPHRGRKSISKETTFEKDVTDASLLNDTLRVLSADVARTARREGLAGAVVTLKVRFAGFETHTRQRKQAAPTDDERGIHRTAWQLFLDSRLPRTPVRLIGVGISGWTEESSVQTDLFGESGAQTPDKRVLETIDAVEDKFGRGLLQVGLSRKTKM